MKRLYTEEKIKDMQNHYEHITKREREIISKHLSEGKRKSYIAQALNRSKSSISAEIKRGWYKGKYVPSIANDRSLAARKKSHAHTKWQSIELQHFGRYRPCRFVEYYHIFHFRYEKSLTEVRPKYNIRNYIIFSGCKKPLGLFPILLKILF